MNKAILIGRLTRDPELRQTGNGLSVCSFTVAVDRRFKSANGERQTDFIPVVAWRQQADFAGRYFKQGMRVAVVGTIQVRSWEDNEGKRRYTTEVVADELEFADGKRDGSEGSSYGEGSRSQGNSFGTSRSGNYGNKSQGFSSQKFSNNSVDFGEDDDDDFFPPPSDNTELPFDL